MLDPNVNLSDRELDIEDVPRGLGLVLREPTSGLFRTGTGPPPILGTGFETSSFAAPSVDTIEHSKLKLEHARVLLNLSELVIMRSDEIEKSDLEGVQSGLNEVAQYLYHTGLISKMEQL